MWVLYTKEVAIMVNVVLAIFLIAFVINGLEIVNKLYINEDEAVSGKFKDFGQY